GYKKPPAVTITPAAGDSTGTGATAEAIVDLTVGSPTFSRVTSVRLKTVGSGYTAPPTVTIGPPPAGGKQAAGVATLYSKPTEVGMLPASKAFPARWPVNWTVNDTPGMTPNILDEREGGVPDPRKVGPSIIQIGSEGGILPAPVVLRNTPIGYEQNKRSVTVLNTMEHTLFMGPAERADIIIDFSQFAGKTLILYNDSPAPVPAGDPRYDHYTAGPDNRAMGGAPSTSAGFGPNTRTVMQIRVGGSANRPAFDPATLNAPMTAAFTKTQPVPVVPAGTYARISDTSMNINGIDTPLKPKTIQELFDPYGRMNATLGVEVPFTSSVVQTTIPYGYIDPATEVIADGETQLWKITHNGVDTHAIHFHLFNVQVVNRVGWDGAIKPPQSEELGWKETVKMNPLEDIVVALRAKTPTVPFSVPNNVRALDPTQPIDSTTGFLGVDPNNNPVPVANKLANFGHEYTWHCHLLGHEENDMMRAVMVAVPPLPPSNLSAAASGGDVLLTWTNTDPGTSGITVQRATDSGFTQNVENFSLGVVTDYTDTTTGGATHFYRVSANGVVGSGVSGYPSVATVSSWSDMATH
ncbi:MAG: multicopper oxidase domain-containing protein, partial [Syntrophobacter sp.]